MAFISYQDREILYAFFAREKGSGYVLDFSDNTFQMYLEENFQININDPQYSVNGISKAKRLFTFLKLSSPALCAKVLRHLGEYWKGYHKSDDNPNLTELYFQIVGKLEIQADKTRTEGIEVFSDNKDLETLVASIQGDIDADRPQAALERLHTYCIAKFQAIAKKYNILDNNSSKQEPLHSLANRCLNFLRQQKYQKDLPDFWKSLSSASHKIFETLNEVRNNNSFSHNNKLVTREEAQLMFDLITSILRFFKRTENAI